MFLPANGRNPQLFHINTSMCLSYIYLQLWLLVCLYQHWQTLSIKGQIVNTSGFEAQTVSITTLQLCHHSAKAAIDQKNETNKQKSPKESWLCSNKTLFVEAVGSQIWPVDHSLPAPGLDSKILQGLHNVLRMYSTPTFEPLSTQHVS